MKLKVLLFAGILALFASPVIAAGGKAYFVANAIMALIFKGTTWSSMAQNDTSSPVTNLCVALHTSDPGPTGDQRTNEAAYTSYAPVAVARTSAAWTVVGYTAHPNSPITFPAATGGTETETWFSIGYTYSNGACTGGSSYTHPILYRGPLTPSISVTTGVAPQISTSTTITEQ